MIIKISVIIATYNRCGSLKDTLESLIVQELNDSFDFEVLVVNNNSKDQTKSLVESYFDKFNGRLRYLFELRQGKSYALNLGIKEARGEILAFTDDDCIVSKDWLKNINILFEKTGCDAGGGRVLPLNKDLLPKKFEKVQDLIPAIAKYDFGEKTKTYNSYIPEFIGANMFFKKVCIESIGCFRDDLGPGRGTFGDDTDVFIRAKILNKSMFYCGEALVWHKVDIKRATLKYISAWWIAQGRYTVIKNSRNDSNKYCCIAGIPRYLLKEIIVNLFLLFKEILNRRSFLRIWQRLFWRVGNVLEYRRLYKCRKLA